jgi:hypothetical protein
VEAFARGWNYRDCMGVCDHTPGCVGVDIYSRVPNFISLVSSCTLLRENTFNRQVGQCTHDPLYMNCTKKSSAIPRRLSERAVESKVKASEVVQEQPASTENIIIA